MQDYTQQAALQQAQQQLLLQLQQGDPNSDNENEDNKGPWCPE